MSRAGDRTRRLDLLAVALPALLAALLAAYELGTRSLWLDEGASVAIASQHGAALWNAIAHDGGNMLAYYVLLHVLITLFGDSAVVIRLPSAVATAATAAIVALIGLRASNRRIALSAGILTAVSLPLVFWGQDARGYALMVTFVAASYLAFAAIIRFGEHAEVPRRLLALYIVGTLLAIYTGFVAAVIIPAQLVALVLARRRAREVIASVLVIAICCVPLLVLALRRGSEQLFWVPAPSLQVLGQAARTLISAGMPPNFHRTATSTVTLLVSTGLLLLAVVAITQRAREPKSQGDRPWPPWRSRPVWGELTVLAWLLVPAALGVVAAKAGAPVELARSSVILMPAVALLLAWVAHHARVPTLLAWAVVAVIVALRALQLAPSYGASPEPWDAAARYVLAATDAPACVAFYPQDGRMPFDYYLDGGAKPGAAALEPVFPPRQWASVHPFVEQYALPSAAQLQAIVRRCPQLWLISSHQGQLHGPSASRADYLRYRALLAALARRYPVQQRRSFGWAAVIYVVRYRQSPARRERRAHGRRSTPTSDTQLIDSSNRASRTSSAVNQRPRRRCANTITAGNATSSMRAFGGVCPEVKVSADTPSVQMSAGIGSRGARTSNTIAISRIAAPIRPAT
ncbi:MAG: glycosyltransferase family 39 protein [Solirubrobacteraceae bacterium]